VAAPEQVKMEMGDGFAAVGAVVDDKAVAGLIELELAGDFLSGGKEMAKNGVMFRGDGGVAGVVLFRNEQDVDRGLGGNVTEREDVVVLVDDVGFGLAVDDPLEDGFGHGPSSLPDGEIEQLGTEVAGAGADKMDDLVIEALAGASPGGGAGEGQNAGPETFQAQHGGEGSDFLVHNNGQALEKDHLHRCFLG